MSVTGGETTVEAMDIVRVTLLPLLGILPLACGPGPGRSAW